MDFLVAALAFGTLGAITVFGYLSARKTNERFERDTPSSTLAPEAPNQRQNNKDTMPDV